MEERLIDLAHNNLQAICECAVKTKGQIQTIPERLIDQAEAEIPGISEDFYKWQNAMMEDYRDTYSSVSRILASKLKEKRCFDGEESMAFQAASAVNLQSLLMDMDNRYEIYEDEFEKAITGDDSVLSSFSGLWEEPKKCYITTFEIKDTLKHRTYYIYYPKQVILWAMNTDYAKKQPVTEQTLKNVIAKTCYKNIFSTLAATCVLLEFYKMVVAQICKFVDDLRKKNLRSKITLISNDPAVSIYQKPKAEYQPGNARRFTLENDPEKTIYYDAMLSLLNMSEKEFHKFTDKSEIFNGFFTSDDDTPPLADFFHTTMAAMAAANMSNSTIFALIHRHYYLMVMNSRYHTYLRGAPEASGGEDTRTSAMEITLQRMSSVDYQAGQSLRRRIEIYDSQSEELLRQQSLAEAREEEANAKIRSADKKLNAAAAKENQLRKRIEELEYQIQRRDDEIEDLIRLEEQSEDPDQEQPDPTEAEVPDVVRTNKHIMVYGGHDSWVNPMMQRFPDCTFRTKGESMRYEGITYQDALVFQTNALSHSSYKSARAEALRANVPIRYIGHAGVQTSAMDLYQIIKSLEEEGAKS